MRSGDPSATGPAGTRKLTAALIVVDLAFAIQQTGVIPAIPTVREDLGASHEWASWLLTAYLVVATVATPALARLADLHDRRRVLLIALAVFLLGGYLLIPRLVEGDPGADGGTVWRPGRGSRGCWCCPYP